MERPDTLFTIGWLIDGSGGPIRRNICMTVQNGRIQHLREMEHSDWDHPALVDLSDSTLVPHLVDSHVHLFMSGTDDTDTRERQLTADYHTARRVIGGHLQSHARCGVMAVRDGGDRSGHSLRFAIESGDTVGVVMRTAGKAWRQIGRYGSLIGRPPPDGTTLAEAILAETTRADHVKIVNSGLNSLIEFGKTTAPQFTLSEMTQAVAASARRGLKVMVHANGALPVEIAVNTGCASIEHGFFMGTDNLVKLTEHGVFWIPTAVTMKAYSEMLRPEDPRREGALRNMEHQFDQIGQARKAGVRIAAGSDAGSLGVHHGPGVIHEMKLLYEAGLSLGEVVQCASSNGAALLNLKKKGVVAAGQKADFVTLKGAPSELFEQLEQNPRIWVEGMRVDSYQDDPKKTS